MNYMAIRAESDMTVRNRDFLVRRKEELMVMKQRYARGIKPSLTYLVYFRFVLFILSSYILLFQRNQCCHEVFAKSKISIRIRAKIGSGIA
jgi:hypothetical protein